jgi:serine/threonine-protein kinase
MGPTRWNDDVDETHRTMPAFGGTDADTDRTTGPENREEEPYEDVSPLPISTPSAEGADELPSVIKPGVELLNKKYRVIRELGRGGMGSVWLVEHKELGQKRALKLIHENYAADKQVRKRFRREAQILASLRHPNAVLVYDYDFIGKVPYIDMEYLKGEPLRKQLKPGSPQPMDFILWVLQELQKVLDQAHGLKIVHRDLKPENIMIVEDPLSRREELKVLDFGIAKIIQQASDENTNVTMDTHGLLGTLAYASPEQNELDPDKAPAVVDHRSDIYSVGVMLFEMLTGHRPFLGGQAQLLFQHAEIPPPTFKKVAPDLSVPPMVEAVVRRCLEKKPESRPNSVAELLADFRRAVEQSETYVGATASGQPSFSPGQPGTVPNLSTNGRSVVTEKAPQATAVQPSPRQRGLPRWVLILGGLILFVPLLWFLASRFIPPNPPTRQETGIPKAVQEFLESRNFRPVPEAKILDGWPVAIRRPGRERGWTLHGKLYLPEGFQPDPETDKSGLPLVVQSPSGVPFVVIHGGTFKMGAFEDRPEFIDADAEKPGHQRKLSTFYMQRTETTIGEFDPYRERQSPGDDKLSVYDTLRQELEKALTPEELARRPAAGVTYRHAVRYAHEQGGELPSEAQWEYVARSRGENWLYVWGNAQGGAKLNVNLSSGANLGMGVWEVGRAKDDWTREGVCDLAGNVRELCRDSWSRYSELHYRSDHFETPPDGEERPRYVIRGGSYKTMSDLARTTFRKQTAGFEKYVASEDEAIDDVGFRVVIEVLVTDDLPANIGSGPDRNQEHSR